MFITKLKYLILLILFLLVSCTHISYTKERLIIDASYEEAKAICKLIHNDKLLDEVKVNFPNFNIETDDYQLKWGKYTPFTPEEPTKIFIEISTTSPQKEKTLPLFLFLKEKVLIQLRINQIEIFK